MLLKLQFTLLHCFHYASGWLNRSSHSVCNENTFRSLTLANIQILSLNITTSYNVSISGQQEDANAKSTIDICRIEMQYTHPGQNDIINTYIGLPLDSSSWNSRFLMEGGGGWEAGGASYVLLPVAAGYASSSTDAGHTADQEPSKWGLVSEGNTNWPSLSDFASVALVEAARLGKQAVQLYYGVRPKYSYWKGCSQGGRQGQMLAQRYPDEFNGIITGCPAISWERFALWLYWPTFMARILDVQPPPCVLDAFTDSAIAECDTIDGVKDGFISLPGQCKFAASSMVGKVVECSDPPSSITITNEIVQLVNSLWTGVTTSAGVFEWYAINKDADLKALLSTSCTSVQNCTVTPFQIGEDWIKVFLARSTFFNMDTVTWEDYDKFFRQSVDEYTSIIGTDNTDLTDLRNSGTKVIVWHGLQDQLVPPDGTIDYYSRIVENPGNGNLSDYYRLFLAPGVEHCGLGNGFDPSNTVLDALKGWVENGTVPHTLTGVGPAVAGTNTSITRSIELCPFPSILSYSGDDPNDSASFTCV